MGAYADDERQSPPPSGSRPPGGPETGRLRRRTGSRGLRTRFSPVLLASGPFPAHLPVITAVTEH